MAGGRPAPGFGATRCAELRPGPCWTRRSRFQARRWCTSPLRPAEPTATWVGQADRRLTPTKCPATSAMGGYQLAIGMDIFRGRFRETLARSAAREGRRAAGIRVRTAPREPCVPARSPHHGASAIKLVPALRPQPADLCALDPGRQAGGLCEGRTEGERGGRRGAMLRCRWWSSAVLFSSRVSRQDYLGI